MNPADPNPWFYPNGTIFTSAEGSVTGGTVGAGAGTVGAGAGTVGADAGTVGAGAGTVGTDVPV